MIVLFYFNLVFIIFLAVIYSMKMIGVVNILNKKYMNFFDISINNIFKDDNGNYFLTYAYIDPNTVNDLTFLSLSKVTNRSNILTKTVLLPNNNYTEGPVSIFFASKNPNDYVISSKNPLEFYIIDIIIFFVIIVALLLYILNFTGSNHEIGNE